MNVVVGGAEDPAKPLDKTVETFEGSQRSVASRGRERGGATDFDLIFTNNVISVILAWSFDICAPLSQFFEKLAITNRQLKCLVIIGRRLGIMRVGEL